MREHKIHIDAMPLEKRTKAISIISKALVLEYGKKVLIVRDGEYTPEALLDIPPSTHVFIISEGG